MIFRYLIFILIGFLLYHLIKKLLKPSAPERKMTEDVSEMVQDQHCGRYVLKRDALKCDQGGEDIFFCSKECMLSYYKTAKNN